MLSEGVGSAEPTATIDTRGCRACASPTPRRFNFIHSLPGKCRSLFWVSAAAALLLCGCVSAQPRVDLASEIATELAVELKAIIDTEVALAVGPITVAPEMPIGSDTAEAESSGDHSPITQTHNDPWPMRLTVIGDHARKVVLWAMFAVGFLYMVKYRSDFLRRVFNGVQGKKKDHCV